MTFSIVARSEDGTRFGVAVASKFLAVGSAVPGVDVAAGAIATQAWANLAYVPRGLALLREGLDAQAVLDQLLEIDDQAEDRQASVVDRNGGSASFTGSRCYDWAGGRTGPGYAIAGNILTGSEVVIEMEKAWLENPEVDFADRLLLALAAGDNAGGDKRGRQSSALLVGRSGGGYGGSSDIEFDLRVDDHVDPVSELGRLLAIHHLLFDAPLAEDLIPFSGDPARRLRIALDTLGWTNLDLETALIECSGVENLEERMVPGLLDPVVLHYLEKRAGLATIGDPT
jgi:uncharacterized Ntn-hydrolase superfamily protein